ncbi:MAG: hypothetical protein H6667_24915 [Ardenticatenaceae bacterium]|nr:hypothetical protein [Ardenticatenaceae bacterium]MCB9445241.1 hypothetical protein [Ardenticatenaceae bacterium]
MSAEVISFPLDRAPGTAKLVYRPWGTRTLKLSVSTGSVTPALRIRPSTIHPDDDANNIFRAYADDSDAFIISWGGGHEPGPCLKSKDVLHAFEQCTEMQPGDSSMIFFNVRHVGPDLPETATVTIEAYNEESGDVFAALPVTLQKPAAYPASAVRLLEASPNVWQPQGDMLAQYDPRWWPKDVAYVAAGDLPLAVVRQEASLSVQWQGKETATITDDTKPSILDMDGVAFELFYFDEWHVALRVWFFWLDANVGGGFFIGRHEVPDAERFDMLIRRADGYVTLACTDLHWREVWGEATSSPLRATLGLSRETKLKLAEEELGKLWGTWKGDKQLEHDRVYNPMRFIERLAEERGKEQAGVQRAKGTEAHLPMLHNVEQRFEEGKPPRMTSSDVRLG